MLSGSHLEKEGLNSNDVLSIEQTDQGTDRGKAKGQMVASHARIVNEELIDCLSES